MRAMYCLFAVLLACAATVYGLVTPLQAGVQIQEAVRVIDISRNVEVQSVEYTIENTGSEPVEFFVIPVSADKSKKLALVEAGAKKQLLDLLVEPTVLDVESQNFVPAGVTLYRVQLPVSVGAGRSAKLFVRSSFTDTLSPLPSTIEQGQSQRVLFEDSTLVLAVYPTLKQSTSVFTATGSVDSFAPSKQGRRSGAGGNGGSVIAFGPYKLAAALSVGDALRVHCENNSAFAVMRTAVRELFVSHWGEVSVSEFYELTHNGAKLRGDFSRASYERNPRGSPSAFEHLHYHAPLDATGFYFRDAIGNVSTSHVRKERDHTHLDVIPRYPLLGGWSADLELGFSVPVGKMLKQSAQSGNTRFTLEASFGVPFADVSADSLVVRVVLPEGASDVRWSAPFGAIAEPLQTMATYLTVQGRPVLELRSANVVAAHSAPLTVSYTFNNADMLRQPLLLVFVLLVLLLSVSVLSRIDLSLGQGSINVTEDVNVKYEDAKDNSKDSKEVNKESNKESNKEVKDSSKDTSKDNKNQGQVKKRK